MQSSTLSIAWSRIENLLQAPEKNRCELTLSLSSFENYISQFLKEFRLTSKSFSHYFPQCLLAHVGSFLLRRESLQMQGVNTFWKTHVQSVTFQKLSKHLPFGLHIQKQEWKERVLLAGHQFAILQ